MGCVECGAPTSNRRCKDCQMFENGTDEVGDVYDVDDENRDFVTPTDCKAIISSTGKQCTNSPRDSGLCGTHNQARNITRVDDIPGAPFAALRDELVDADLNGVHAYRFATQFQNATDLWDAVTSLEPLEIGDKTYSDSGLATHAKTIATLEDVDAGNHPLAEDRCIALTDSDKFDGRCTNGGYGTGLLCGTHKQAINPETILDDGEPGPDLDTVTVDGDEYLFVEKRGGDLIVVDEDEFELLRIKGAAGSESRWKDEETTPDLDDDAETLVLVGCGDAKADESCPAKNLYTSNYFGLKRRYAEEFGDEWAILSAKYGLLDPDAEIEPYDLTVDDVDVGEWELAVLDDLPDVRGTDVVLLAGPDYADVLEGDLFMYGADADVPGDGKKIGERMSWLSDQLDEDDSDTNKDESDSDVEDEDVDMIEATVDEDEDEPLTPWLEAIDDVADTWDVSADTAESFLEHIGFEPFEKFDPEQDEDDQDQADPEDWIDPFVFENRVDELEDVGLSGREAEVVAAKEQGLTHVKIAEYLDLPKSTVDEYSRRARRKVKQARTLVDAAGDLYE